MARRSPPLVNQTYETGCTWRMFRIFNFREGHADKRLVSDRRHFSSHVNGNGNSRSSSDALSTVDEKYLQIGVKSRRKRDYGCKSIGCVENDQEAHWRNEITKMIVDQRFVNTNYLGKDGEDYQPNQFLDALQILYSNKELFIKLLQDPNSLLVKQIHDLESSKVKEPYQARLKRTTRLNKPQKSNATQCVKPFEFFDRYDFRPSCKPQSPNRIVVLKPGMANVKKNAETSCISNAQDIRPSYYPFGRIKRKLRHVMRVRKQEKQCRTDDGKSCKFPSNSQGLEDGKKVKELEIDERNSPINVHSNTGKRLNSYLDLKKQEDIIKFKNSELCMRLEAASFGGSCSKNTNNTSVGPSEQNKLNINVEVEGRKGPSQMLNCGIEECKQCTNSLGRSIPLPDFLSLPRFHRCEHSSITEGMRYYNDYQMVLRTTLGILKDGENGSHNSLRPEIKDPPVAIVNTLTDKLQSFGEDISIRNRVPGDNLRAHYDIPRDGRYEESSIQNIDMNNTTEGSESFLDLHPEIQTLTFSPEVAPSSLSSCQGTEDTVNMGNRVENFIGHDATAPPITIFHTDESPIQAMHDNKFEENHLADLIRSSFDPMNNLTSTKDILNYVREIQQAFILKRDELSMKRSSNQLLDPSTFDELKELISQLSSDTMLLDCVIEAFIELYQNNGFPHHISSKNPSVQAYVVKKLLVKEITELVNLHFHPHPSPLTLEKLVEMDLARRGSWLNIQVDTEEIAIEVEEDVLEKLVLEIASEMDIET